MASIDLSQLIGYSSGWEVESSIFVGADELAGKAGKLGRPINDVGAQKTAAMGRKTVEERTGFL